MKRIALFIVVLSLATAWLAAGEPICIGEIITIDSEIMGEQRTIHISTPVGYSRSLERYPVLYMTDGPQHITHTRGTVDFLSRNGLMPQLIIVGVANTDRTRDLTPTHADTVAPDGTVRKNPTSGGADKLLDFFEKELFPAIDSGYRTAPLRLFSGHSYGGLFALNALFTRPGMFRDVLAVSPSLHWDEGLALRRAEAFFKDRPELNSTLVVTMADEERNDPSPTRLDRLEETLQKADAAGFAWKVFRFPDERHNTVVLRSQYWGLREIFSMWRMPRGREDGPFEGAVEDIKSHYAALSKHFGYDIRPAEDLVNNLGYQVFMSDRTDDAIAIFRYNVALHPKAANPWDSLGEAYEKAGNMSEAIRCYSRAIENAKANGDERLEVFSANLRRLRKELAK